MFNFKVIFRLIFAFLIFQSLGQAKDWKKIRIGVEGAYPPFSKTLPSGKVVGFDIDIAMALCAELKAQCKLVPQDWDGMIPALYARKYDAIVASMSITPERQKKVAFSEKYYQTPAKFVAKKGAGITISKAGLKGKSVGVQRGTIHDRYLTGEYGKGVTIKRYGTLDEAYLDLQAGRLDMILADSVPASEGFLKKPAGAKFEFVGPDLLDEKYFGKGVGIAVRKQNKDLAQKFSQAIKTIRSNGVYQKIQKKYFNFDIYGK